MSSVRALCASSVRAQSELADFRKMQFAARRSGVQTTMGTPRFRPEGAPVGLRTERLLGPRRPTGQQVNSIWISKPIKKRPRSTRPHRGSFYSWRQHRGGYVGATMEAVAWISSGIQSLALEDRPPKVRSIIKRFREVALS